LRAAAAAVADDHLDVLDPELVEALAGPLAELGNALDADDAPSEPRQHRGGVARAGADLEHGLRAAELERLADRCDDPRLGDRLLRADRERRVVVGAPPPPLGHEVLAGDLPHRTEDALVGDAPPAELALHHRGPLLCEVAGPTEGHSKNVS